jgi:predicted RNA-binding protein YlxR (DUF448 family)
MSPDLHGPERTCVGCRSRSPQEQLIRLTMQGNVLRVGRGLPGRGAWLHPTLACLQQAERRSAFGRALRFTRVIDTSELRSHLEGPDLASFAL